MSIQVDVKDLPHKLTELMAQVARGDEVIVTDQDVPCAKLTGIAPQGPRILGLNRGVVTYIAPDFDDPLPHEFWFGEDEKTTP